MIETLGRLLVRQGIDVMTWNLDRSKPDIKMAFATSGDLASNPRPPSLIQVAYETGFEAPNDNWGTLKATYEQHTMLRTI